MGKTVFVASGKGGVGKSTLVTGLAVCLASMGAEVLCIDADAGIRSLDLLLGVTDRTSLDLGDVLRGDVPLEKLRALAGEELVIWGGLPGAMFTPVFTDAQFEEHIEKLLSLNDPKMILGVADQVPPDAVEHRIREI